MKEPGPNQDVLVVVPAFNEESMIGGVVEELARQWPVLVVDDGSADATAERAAAAGAIVLRHCINRGQGAALQTALDWARRTRKALTVVTFDADGQHSMDDIGRLVQPIREGRADVVMGSRFLGASSGIPPVRKLLIRAAVLFTWAASGVRLTDAHNGLRALGPAAVKRIELRQDRMAHASELVDQIFRAGLRIEEAPVSIRYTSYSLTKGQRNRDALRALMDYVAGRILG